MDKRADLILASGIEKHLLPASDPRWGPSYVPIHSRSFEKLASECYVPVKLIKLIETLKPRKEGRYVHINAVGALHAWGSNSNGDAFPRWGLLHETPPDDVLALLRERSMSIPAEYGHETFETYAYPFTFHDNKDPLASIGEKVTCSAYNDQMERVELIVFILESRAPDLVRRIDAGDPIPWSMGCFPAGTPITMANGTSKPIEEIKVGDLVLTHTGAVKKVTALHPRPYEGTLLDFDVEGGSDFSVTNEHPFWAASRDKALKNGRWVDNPETEFLHAGCLNEGDYLTTPVMGEVLTPDYATPALAALLGYYLAEGHVLRNKAGEYAGVEFTANKDDVILDEIEDIAKAFGTRSAPIIRPRANSEHAVRIDIFDPHLAEICYDHCGSYGRGKRLSEDVMQWHPDLQKHLLGKYLNGDGHQMTSWRKGAAIISTASDSLAEQIPHMLARVGIPATVNLLRHEAGSGFNESVTFEHQIYIGKQYVNILAEFSKIEPVECRSSGSGARLISGQIFKRVKGVQERFFQGFVYNFEVEDDESYVAAGYGAHNCKVPFDVCSICKNTAKNRSEYCSHLRTLMNVTLPDGRKVYALNLFPKFFDISYVISPAWKEAWSLRKIACADSPTIAVPLGSTREMFMQYEPDFMKIAAAQSRFQKAAVLKRAEEKAAEIEKQVPADKGQDNLGTAPIKPVVYRELKKLVSAHGSETRMLPGLDLKKLKEEPLSDVLGGATACGIQLKRPELDELTDGDASKMPESLDFESPSSRIMSVLKRWIPERSLFDPPFAKRVIRIIRIGGPVESGVEKRSSGSAAYDKYCELLQKVDVEKLAAKANELEILMARDPMAVDQSLAAVKTAEVDERIRAVIPFVVSAGINRG